MNNPAHSDSSLDFYQQNAQTFVERTLAVNMEHLYAEFLPFVPVGGKILDAGCGSGRDSAYFKKCGHPVTAFDASSEIAALASKLIRQPVQVMGFLDVNFKEEFEAVWACASLLHVAQADMDEAVQRLTHSLKLSGVIYASFKHGSGDGVRNGRFFNDYDEPKLERLLAHHPTLKLIKVWRTTDARPDHPDESWLNFVCRRNES